MASTVIETGRVRRATFSDLQAIIDINDNVSEGLDYFPGTFFIYMHSKRHAIYVYEQNGKVLGVVNFKFHPDEKDLANGMSGRVHSSLQGQGLTRDEGPFIKQIMKDHPNLTRYVGDTLLKPNIEEKLHKLEPLFIWIKDEVKGKL